MVTVGVEAILLFFSHRQLTAAGGDVDAAALADGAGYSELVAESALEMFDGIGPRGRSGITRGGVEWDEVHLRGQAEQQAADGAGCSIDSSATLTCG